MIDLAARIAAHPVAAAAHRLGMAEYGVRHAAAGTTEEYVRALAVHDAAEGALIVALDTDDAKAGDLQHHLTPLIGWLRTQHLASEEDRLAAIAKIVDGIRVLEPEFDVDRTLMSAASDVRATDDPEVRRRLPNLVADYEQERAAWRARLAEVTGERDAARAAVEKAVADLSARMAPTSVVRAADKVLMDLRKALEG